MTFGFLLLGCCAEKTVHVSFKALEVIAISFFIDHPSLFD